MKHGYHTHLEHETTSNTSYRKVLYTGEHMQLVLMSLKPGEEIGLEIHHDNDQFFRFDAGEGTVIINETTYQVTDGDAIVIPAGAQHNIMNSSDTEDLKLYTIYTPPHHADGINHETKVYADAHETDFDGTTTE